MTECESVNMYRIVVWIKCGTAQYYFVKPINFLWYNHCEFFRVMNGRTLSFVFPEVKEKPYVAWNYSQ